ncbi:endonuclease/exonuclease/phosphatase family protein [Kineosporia babensis]|uniref:Endonuclease/exonuclease/phosphatase domain-containing protein n=1 Tax=Kineosporia babensis TaxID=499548 RepID=A0A9X1NEQ4_9ACTN|nr:endonuclease/exonuclease/phosphatase family protein [Kineosporia babensis]MCD5313627.1 hypothetical protein [Kineosporia babensis]
MTSPGEGSPLKVASLNLSSGRSSRGTDAGPQALAEAVRTLDVDVLACQEVDFAQPRSGLVDQTAEIARAMQTPYARFAPTVLGTPGEPGWEPALPAEGSHPVPNSEYVPFSTDALPRYGVCLVSRLEVKQWHELRLAPSPGRFPMPVPGRMIWLRDEPRVALAAVLTNGVSVVCTHLSFVPGVNLRQLRRIRRWLNKLRLPGPVLMLGDLNMPPLPVQQATGWTPLVSGATFPALRPGVQLDHVLGVGLPPGISARGELVSDLPVGDHRAVRVHLDLRPR